MLAGEFEHYHGEAVNPIHLSTWERLVWKWHQHYDPALDAEHKAIQQTGTALQKAKQAEYMLSTEIAAGPRTSAASPDALPASSKDVSKDVSSQV